jgi:lysine 6-dehydrogenase
MDVVDRQMLLDADARQAGVTILPNSGLAPGMANVLAHGLYARLDRCDSLRIRVGGLPLDRPEPIGYRLLFSVRGLTNEYLEPAEVIRGGKRTTVPSLTDIEPLEFPPPFGALEAFHTSGGASLLPRLLEGKVQTLDYKTIRYPGHGAVFHAISRLGLLSEERPFGPKGPTVREATEAALVGSLGGPPRPDVTLVRVTSTGTKDGETLTIEQELIEYADAASGHSAMMRTTSYSAVAMLELVLSGTVSGHGVLAQERAVPSGPFVRILARRGIHVRERAFPSE